MKTISFKTSKRKEILNITDKINKTIQESNLNSGICNLHIKHTTAAVTTADLDPGTDKDMLDAFEEIIPDINYRHPHDPSHVGDHIMSTMIGSNISIPFKGQKLVLGTWQEVVLVELNGPKERSLVVSLIKI